MKNTLLNAAMLCGCTFSAASFAADPPAAAPTYSAGEVRGQLAVELTIGKGCEVVNGSVNGANAFGTLSFGEVSSLTNNSIDAQAKGTAGAIVQLNCTKDVSYRVSLDDGRNSSGQGARRLALVGGAARTTSYRTTCTRTPRASRCGTARIPIPALAAARRKTWWCTAAFRPWRRPPPPESTRTSSC
nr:spore coat protein U domain-containing protein [Achromobacter ruhlandii]